jgi:tuftelin-interacting protein 11
VEQPDFLVRRFKKWRKLLRLDVDQETDSVDADFISSSGKGKNKERDMTPYESLMWNEWLPKVRKAVR